MEDRGLGRANQPGDDELMRQAREALARLRIAANSADRREATDAFVLAAAQLASRDSNVPQHARLLYAAIHGVARGDDQTASPEVLADVARILDVVDGTAPDAAMERALVAAALLPATPATDAPSESAPDGPPVTDGDEEQETLLRAFAAAPLRHADWRAPDSKAAPAQPAESLTDQHVALEANLDVVPPEVHALFFTETTAEVEMIARLVAETAAHPNDLHLLSALGDIAHTIKGAAGTLGYTEVADAARGLEDVARALTGGRAAISRDALDVLHTQAATLAAALTAAGMPQGDRPTTHSACTAEAGVPVGTVPAAERLPSQHERPSTSSADAGKPGSESHGNGDGVEPPSVLVVDDSASIRHMLAALLQRDGFLVRVARDGVEAVEELVREPADVVVLDLEMPRLDGFGVLETLRAEPTLAAIPVAVLTAQAGTAYRERAWRLGADAYLPKPCRREALIGTLRDLLAARVSASDMARFS